jgi:hypothetical protein
MPANCDNCRHHVGDELGLDRRRECRASAPAFARECTTPAYGKHPVFLACWPLTLPSDGCGHWSAIPAPATPPAVASPPPAVAPAPEPAADPAKKSRRKGE